MEPTAKPMEEAVKDSRHVIPMNRANLHSRHALTAQAKWIQQHTYSQNHGFVKKRILTGDGYPTLLVVHKLDHRFSSCAVCIECKLSTPHTTRSHQITRMHILGCTILSQCTVIGSMIHCAVT